MEMIDKRKNYILLLDTETAGSLANPLVYDFGCVVIDKQGKVYESYRAAVREVITSRHMNTAYYAEKIPQYWEMIRSNQLPLVSFWRVKRTVWELCEKYNIKQVCAHNANFDYKALANTQKVLAAGVQVTEFFPVGVSVWDTLLMAKKYFKDECKSYRKYCEKYDYLTKRGEVRLTAEILYRYISGRNDFIESHTALDDCMIEKEILAYFFRRKKKMEKVLIAR